MMCVSFSFTFNGHNTMEMMFILLCMLAVANTVVGYAHLNYPILCSKLKPVPSLDINQLDGSWVTVEALLLRDGYPEPPANSHRKTCVRTLVSETSESGMSMVSEVHLGKAKRRTGRTKFIINNPEQPGRWNMMSRRPTALVTEMLVIAARPSQFLVLAFCQPYNEDEEYGSSSRPALWVKILARPSSSHGAMVDSSSSGLAINKKEMTMLRERVKEMLGLREIASVHFDTTC